MTAQSPMTDEHYILLGKIAEAAGRLEYEAALLAGDLIDPDPDISFKITSGLSFERLMSLAKQLAAVKAPDEQTKQRLDDVARRAETAMRERNQLLHGRWVFVDDESGTTLPAIRTRTRRGEVTLRMFADVQELRDILARMHDAYFFLQTFHLGCMSWSGAFEPYGDGGLRRIKPPWRAKDYS